MADEFQFGFEFQIGYFIYFQNCYYNYRRGKKVLQVLWIHEWIISTFLRFE